MEPRRIALAVVLMAAVLIVTPFLFPTPNTTAPSVTTIAADSLRDSLRDTASSAMAGSSSASAADSSLVGADSSANAATLIPVDTSEVRTALADFRTTNRGAALIGATMSQYKALDNRGRARTGAVELARDEDQLLSFRLVIPGDTIALDQQIFQTTESKRSDTTIVQYTAQLSPAGAVARSVSFTYSFLPDSYRVNVAAAVTGTPDSSYLLIELPHGFHNSEADSVEASNHLAYAYKPAERGAKGVPFRKLDPGERRIEPGPITWAVAKSKYFILGVIAPKGSQGFVEADFVGAERTGKLALDGNATLVAPIRPGVEGVKFELYAGPQEFKRLVAVGQEFEASNPYGGWIQGIVQPFAVLTIQLLLWMKNVLGLSYGWILVIFGVAIRVLLWPLNQKAMRSQMQIQRIGPEMKEIQTKYKDDPKKQQAAMMQLYKDHGMSPFSSLSGCLPMLIPMPVFFALFFVFQNTIEFRGVPFLWLPDISVKDPYYILPILVAISALLMSWIGMRGQKAGDQQKIMLYVMPVIMLFFFINFASGLNLYYLIQNIASLPQQWIIAHERRQVKTVQRG